ncbi:MAG: ThuA domain-containing protein [Deltaproteobacteria bacterium]|nr:ThuA domain-containing protein [Deltaproteobacteria bacterium]
MTLRAAVWCVLAFGVAGCERPRPECAADLDAVDHTGDGGERPLRVLIYTRATGFRHDSIPKGATTIAALAMRLGASSESTEDPARITEDSLAPLGAVVLVSTTGEPLGAESGPAPRALENFVRRGGGLLGVHAVADAYGCGPYTRLIGAVFRSHPGNTRVSTCFTEGDHPAITSLPASFQWQDEYHLLHNFREDNRVALRCLGVDGVERVPIAWYRNEGAGRVFVTTLGHAAERFDDPRMTDAHLLPALRWVLQR